VPLASVTPEGLLTPAEALRDLPSVVVDDDGVRAVGFGKVLPFAVLGLADDASGPWAVLDDAGRLLAVYEVYEPSSPRHADGERSAKPAVVVAPAEPGSSARGTHG